MTFPRLARTPNAEVLIGQYRDERRKRRLMAQSKQERAAYHRAYREAHLEERRAYDYAYRKTEAYQASLEARREKRLAWQRVYNTTHQEERRAYYEAHRERWRAQARAWYTAHRPYAHTWDKIHPQEHAEKERRRRARQHGAIVGSIDMEAIKVRDRMMCCICGKRVTKKDLSFDHTIPLSLGGPHSQENLRVAHRRCNSQRGVGRLPVQMVLL